MIFGLNKNNCCVQFMSYTVIMQCIATITLRDHICDVVLRGYKNFGRNCILGQAVIISKIILSTKYVLWGALSTNLGCMEVFHKNKIR